MKSIEDFICTQDDEFVRWTCDGVPVIKKFDAKVYAECFKEKDGVVVVIRSKAHAPNNAIIFNADGSERVVVNNPVVDRGAAIFSDTYYVKDELALIAKGNIVQFSCVIDKNGNVLSVKESR